MVPKLSLRGCRYLLFFFIKIILTPFYRNLLSWNFSVRTQTDISDNVLQQSSQQFNFVNELWLYLFYFLSLLRMSFVFLIIISNFFFLAFTHIWTHTNIDLGGVVNKTHPSSTHDNDRYDVECNAIIIIKHKLITLLFDFFYRWHYF